MTEQIIIAGSGGQGIMLLGKVLTESGLINGYKVIWFPTYGAEVRGGAAHCMVIISSDDIPSPYINKADTLIIMNELSMSRFKHRIKKGGLLLINSSLVNKNKLNCSSSDTNQVYQPFSETAVRLGNIRIANMVALGVYLAKKKIFSKEVVFKAIEEIAPAEKRNLIQINKRAIEEGLRLAR